MKDPASRQPPWRYAASLLGAGLGGAGAAAIHVPLPWVMGSMAGAAVLAVTGWGARQPRGARYGAQVVVGTALGLTFTQAVLAQVGALWFWLALGAAFSLGLTALFAPLLQRLTGQDAATAIYAVAAGASSEMALQAQRAGANGALVASAHAVRIILVVSLASVVAHWSGEHGAALAQQAVPLLSLPMTLLFVALAPASALLANRVHVPNGWLLGPVIMAGAFAATGLQAKLHPGLLIAAQIIIGWNLGQYMTRAFFVKSPRMLASAALVTLGMIALCIGVAWSLHWLLDVSLLTVFLSLAPGGTAEMALVAKTYGIGAPIVTTFHFVRVVATIVLVQHLARWLMRSGWMRETPPTQP